MNDWFGVWAAFCFFLACCVLGFIAWVVITLVNHLTT